MCFSLSFHPTCFWLSFHPTCLLAFFSSIPDLLLRFLAFLELRAFSSIWLLRFLAFELRAFHSSILLFPFSDDSVLLDSFAFLLLLVSFAFLLLLASFAFRLLSAFYDFLLLLQVSVLTFFWRAHATDGLPSLSFFADILPLVFSGSLRILASSAVHVLTLVSSLLLRFLSFSADVLSPVLFLLFLALVVLLLALCLFRLALFAWPLLLCFAALEQTQEALFLSGPNSFQKQSILYMLWWFSPVVDFQP